MEESQTTSGYSRAEYEDLLQELKTQSQEAQKILDILVPLMESGENHRTLFEEIYKNIKESHKEITSSKSANTKYLNDLKARDEEVKTFLDTTTAKQKEIKDILKKIKDIEKKASRRFEAIENLKEDINDKKKRVTTAKNDALGLVEKIRKFKGESFNQIKELRLEKKESERIIKFLKKKEEEVTKSHEIINAKYLDLFNSQSGKKSKIEKLDENIENISSFHQKLNEEVQPNIEEKQDYLKDLKTDIETKRNDIDALLSNATVRSLAEGYLESMHEYSGSRGMSCKKIKNFKHFLWIPYNLACFIFNLIFRHSVTLINYCIFILPLIAVCVIFIEPEFIKEILKTDSDVSFTGVEFIFYKISVSFPLLWISWFGQKNISQRKRLFEEYNHKLRVVQMYIMFNSSERSYELNQKDELELVLLDVIKNNPAENLGKGDTIIDRVFEKFQLGGFYKKLKEEIMNDLKNLVKSSVHNK